MGVNELATIVMSNVTWINMMLLIIVVAVSATAYGLYYKLKRVEKDLDDIYYLLADIDEKIR